MDFLKPFQLYITLGLAVVVVIQFAMLMGTRSRLASISRMMRTLFAGPEGTDLEAMLKSCLAQSEAAVQKTDELESHLIELSQTMRGCIQHCGLVRYDAFGDVSGQQSFSLALLDARQNGAVISGLFSRADSRCYGKTIIGGAPEQSLTEEEQRALDIAMRGEAGAPLEASTPGPRRRSSRRQRSAAQELEA
jgi:hypothetical protein